jgi:peptidyl-prolyl cis-trans isomerase C
MQRVAAAGGEVSDVDVQLYYEMHLDKFTQPELRSARHILITVNPEFPENTREAARARMEQMVEKLAGRANRFSQFAQQNSECPTAMEGGKLGEVKQGQLYPELDSVLFAMEEGEISSIIESEMGFHILLCEKIKEGKRVAFSKVEEKVRALLAERQRRGRQREWLNTLRGAER